MPVGNAAVTASARKKLARRILPIVVIGVFILVWLIGVRHEPSSAKLRGYIFTLEVMKTPEEVAVGLSGRAGLNKRAAMLFVFDESGKHCFWMRDMKFSIDILWFDEGKKLIHQERNLSPDTYPAKYCPDEDAKYVLEVNAGISKQHGVEEGDEIELFNL